MYLIVGLGNPEEEYASTRHNMGFNTINKLSKKFDININKSKFKGLYGLGNIYDKKVLLLKPQTYMNLSGESIIQVVDFYKIPLEDILIIYDDIDVEPGKIKIRKKGGPGSHNGMKSVIKNLDSQEFARIRVGIGAPKYKNDMINYVIGYIPEEEKENLEKGTDLAVLAVEEIIKNGIDIAMNKFN